MCIIYKYNILYYKSTNQFKKLKNMSNKIFMLTKINM